jgi:hypothetical protein
MDGVFLVVELVVSCATGGGVGFLGNVKTPPNIEVLI